MLFEVRYQRKIDLSYVDTNRHEISFIIQAQNLFIANEIAEQNCPHGYEIRYIIPTK